MMHTITTSRLSPSATWRRKDEETKERSGSGSWRDRKGSKESAETEESGETMEKGETLEKRKPSPETREMTGSWRVSRQEKAEAAEETGVDGEAMPSEWKLQKMYKQLKIDNAKFTTWLVESIYPCRESLLCSERLPPYVTLSAKQAKALIDHSKYDIVVNNTTDLARETTEVPPIMLALLDRLIVERTDYTHWMSLKATDYLSKLSYDSHIHYIKVLREVRSILAERLEPHREIACQAKSLDRAETTTTSPITHSPTLGKRKNSSNSTPNPNQRKAVKTEPTPKEQQGDWRRMISESYEKTADKRCAHVAKPISYAAALRVAPVS